MKVSGRIFLIAATAVLVQGAATANDSARQTETPAQASPAQSSTPVVVEMFLSQSCSSCTDAAALMPDLAARKDVIALSWHVDYWNMLNTKDGRWVDPYSEAAYTVRQKTYNMRLRNRSSVYTPQAVVDGGMETVGSSREKINDMIATAAATQNRAAVVAAAADGALSFQVSKSDAGGNAFLVTFKREATTTITRGENAGRTFAETNVVTGIQPLGIVLKRGAALTAGTPPAGEGCALIVQEPKQARIIAAAYCPTSS